jgi:hypothetical protein
VNNQLSRPSADARAQQQNASASQDTPMRVSPRPVIQTPQPEAEPNRHEWREEQDLKAQRDMATWAFWMLFVTAIGVAFVARTLRAALDANKGFALASQQQLTAYVLGENPQILQVFTPKDQTKYRLQFQMKLKNTGQTPAFDVFNICRVIWDTEAAFANWVVEAEPTSRAVIGPGSEMFAVEVLKGKDKEEIAFTNELVQELIQRGATVWLKGHLLYRDINGRLWRHDYSWRLLDPKLLLANPVAENGKWKRREIGLYANATGNDLRIIEDPNEKK